MNGVMLLDRWMRWPLVALLGVLWLAVTGSSFRSLEVGEHEVDPEVIARYYDRDLRLLEAGERAGALGRWVAGADEARLIYQDCLDALGRGHAEALGDDGDALVRLLELKLDGGAGPPAAADNDRLRPRLLAGDGPAWEYETFVRATGDRGVEAVYQRQNDRLLWRVAGTRLLFDGLMVLGLACALGLLVRRGHVEVRPHRLCSRWPVRVVLGAYFLVFLLLEPWSASIGWLYDLLAQGLPELPLYIVYDVAYRGFDACLLAGLLFGTPAFALRVLGRGRGVAWLPLLAVLGVQSLLEIGLFRLAPVMAADPTDFLEVADPDAGYLVAMFLSSVVVAPLFEEIVFRGLLFQGLRGRLGNLGAGALSTLLFALAHAQYDHWGLLSVGLSGAATAYLTLRTGSLATAIVYHAVLNLFACGGVWLQYQLPL